MNMTNSSEHKQKLKFTKKDILEDVVLDLDDFYGDYKANALNILFWLKWKFPKFKVTLFAIPYYLGQSQQDFFRMLKKFDWIQLAVHGWSHNPPDECAFWNKDTVNNYLDRIERTGVFVKGFKAPNWTMSEDTYAVLKKRGYWIADLVTNKDRQPKGLRVYDTDHPWMVHGHTWNISNPQPNCRNGIQNIIETIGVPWNEKSNFHFIDEIMR